MVMYVKHTSSYRYAKPVRVHVFVQRRLISQVLALVFGTGKRRLLAEIYHKQKESLLD